MYNVISLFSGCGGSSLGYKQAGFNVLFANEFVPAAAETYKANFPNTIIDSTDVRKVTAEYILNEIGMKKGELDLMDGSPPCGSFSMLGNREGNWGKTHHYSDGIWQQTDDLYFEYIRILKGIQPKVFLAENVAALASTLAKGYFNDIFKGLTDAGYKVQAAILNAQYYGVPQSRKRLFFMGVRGDLPFQPSFPSPTVKKLVTVREAFKGVENSEWELHEARDLYPGIKEWVRVTPTGMHTSEIHPKGSYYSMSRLSWNKPSPTVITISRKAIEDHKCSALLHPTETRYLTISELKRICTFPDDFKVTGNFSQKWERFARAVPPLLMKTLANHIKVNLLDRIHEVHADQTMS